LYAIERGLVNPKEIEVIGGKRTINYEKPKNMNQMKRSIVSKMMNSVPMYPYVIQDKCVKCRICEKVCPKNALSMTPYPKVDKKKCINCYCCHENCPHNALELKGSWLFQTIMWIRDKKNG